MKKRRLKELNNQGSTFVMAIIVITLVTILAVAILGASTHNLAMKNVDRNSKDTFYTAESVIDEVRAGTGIDSMNILGKAYEAVITGLVKDDPDGFEYLVNNDEANKEFKTIFIESMLEKITGKKADDLFKDAEEYECTDGSLETEIITYLKTFIVGYDDMAVIKSIGNLEAYKQSNLGRKYMIIIRDVSIQYKEEKSGETYFSNVTMDLEIQFPNMTVDFSATNRLKDYIKYVFIADDDINIEGFTVDSTACIYAGGIIDIKSTHSLAALNMSGTTEPINLICGGNNNTTSGTISIAGSSNQKAAFSAAKTNVWCTNIKTNPDYTTTKDSTLGADVTISSDCSTFVKDDLTVDGQDSTVNVAGEYYGYSYEGASLGLGAYHANSSAMIINGQRAKLTIGTDYLLLGGHSFIDYTDSSNADYMTGEALSFKGAQEIYLIPSQYFTMKDGTTVSNPMPAYYEDSNGNSVPYVMGTDIICDVSDFFAYKKGYLSTSIYETRIENGLMYVYCKFKNTASAAQYISDIVNKKNGAPASLYNKLNQYTENLFVKGTGSVKIDVDSGAKLYTSGVLLTTGNGNTTGAQGSVDASKIEAGGVKGASSHVALPMDELALTSMDLGNRYSILTHLLADIPWEHTENVRYIVNDVDQALFNKKNYVVSYGEMGTPDIFDNIVDRTMVEADSYNTSRKVIVDEDTGKRYIKIAVKGSFTVEETDDYDGGIIVATGTVFVKKDFEGMIIAGQNIDVEQNVTVGNNATIVENLITTERAYEDGSYEEDSVPFSEYFHAYKHSAIDDDSREEVKVEKVNYKDIVKVNNWRKYED